MTQKLKVVEGVAFAFVFLISFFLGAVVWAVPQTAKMTFADGSQGFSDRFILVTNPDVGELPVITTTGNFASTGFNSLDRL